jgi:hypothetical protein
MFCRVEANESLTNMHKTPRLSLNKDKITFRTRRTTIIVNRMNLTRPIEIEFGLPFISLRDQIEIRFCEMDSVLVPNSSH